MVLRMSSFRLFNEIKHELVVVETELQKYVQTPNELLTDASGHLLKAGGKRLRPAFVLLGGKFHHFSLERLLPLAVAMELVHMASLVHDDVIDASQTRRGIPTVKARWGNRISLHTGDYLFARALMLIASYEDPAITKILADASIEMCQGEIQQIVTSFDPRQTFRDYFYRIRRKTALLISASCRLGAMVSGAPEEISFRLKRYGHYVGMAFQITDDILDLTADQEVLGKPVGSDLRQGILTLPVIHALTMTEVSRRLSELVPKADKNEDEMAETIKLVRKSGAIDFSFAVANRYVEKAKKELRFLPAVPARKSLQMIADFVRERKF